MPANGCRMPNAVLAIGSGSNLDPRCAMLRRYGRTVRVDHRASSHSLRARDVSLVRLTASSTGRLMRSLVRVDAADIDIGDRLVGALSGRVRSRHRQAAPMPNCRKVEWLDRLRQRRSDRLRSIFALRPVAELRVRRSLEQHRRRLVARVLRRPSFPCTASCSTSSRIFATASGASANWSNFSKKVSSFIQQSRRWR